MRRASGSVPRGAGVACVGDAFAPTLLDGRRDACSRSIGFVLVAAIAVASTLETVDALEADAVVGCVVAVESI